MKELKKILVVLIIGLALSGGTVASFGQHNGNSNNRPRKEDQRIKETPKQPPSNSNRSGKPH